MFRIRNLVMPEKIHVDTGSTAVSFKTILAWGVIQINSSLEQEEWSKKFVNNRHESLSRSYKGENIDAVKDISWVMHMLINTETDDHYEVSFFLDLWVWRQYPPEFPWWQRDRWWWKQYARRLWWELRRRASGNQQSPHQWSWMGPFQSWVLSDSPSVTVVCFRSETVKKAKGIL